MEKNEINVMIIILCSILIFSLSLPVRIESYIGGIASNSYVTIYGYEFYVCGIVLAFIIFLNIGYIFGKEN